MATQEVTCKTCGKIRPAQRGRKPASWQCDDCKTPKEKEQITMTNNEQPITVRGWANIGTKDEPVFRALSDEALDDGTVIYVPRSQGGVSKVFIDGAGEKVQFGGSRLIPAGEYFQYATRKDESEKPKFYPKKKSAPKQDAPVSDSPAAESAPSITVATPSDESLEAIVEALRAAGAKTVVVAQF